MIEHTQEEVAAVEDQRTYLKGRLRDLKYQHYTLLVDEHIISRQNPGSTDPQKMQHKARLEELRGQIGNAKVAVAEMSALLNELPPEETPSTTTTP